MLQVSGGIFIHTETTKVHVAKSLLSGISAGFEESRADSRPGQEYNVKFEFAYDEDVFKTAYEQLLAKPT
jgi:hypothetical protein